MFLLPASQTDILSKLAGLRTISAGLRTISAGLHTILTSSTFLCHAVAQLSVISQNPDYRRTECDFSHDEYVYCTVIKKIGNPLRQHLCV